MKYRARNIRTDVAFLEGEEYALSPVGSIEPEWVLEFEFEDEWLLSSFHARDILGVKDPRTFDEIKEQLRRMEAS